MNDYRPNKNMASIHRLLKSLENILPSTTPVATVRSGSGDGCSELPEITQLAQGRAEKSTWGL